MPTHVNCPTCKQSVVWSAASPFRPFCSERCKLIDLGEWAAENHRIADQSSVDPELAEAYLAELEAELLAQQNRLFKED